jgi:large subunit ribosomal protein L13
MADNATVKSPARAPKAARQQPCRRQTTLHLKPLPKRWLIVDAQDVPLGRLAVEVATVLQGKHRPDYTPHVDSGDFVIVTNAQKVGLTGNKADHRLKNRYSGYPGGLKSETYGQVRDRKPEKLVQDAVRRMLPKNRLARVMLKNMMVYPGAEHPYAAHQPKTLLIP